MPTFKLTLQSGSGMGTEFPLEKTELFLGRDLSNDIVINDSEVSRRHARLVQSGNTYMIEDLGSTNGTFIRGERIASPISLMSGETILLGEKVLLRFEISGVQADATVAAFRPGSQPVKTAQPAAPAPAAQVPVTPAAPPRSQPAAPVYSPPVQPAAPAYTPPVQPVAPSSVYTPVQPAPVTPYAPAQKKKKGWLVALLIVVGVILIFCIIPAIIVEVTNSYCALFPGIFNAWQPGACP